MKSTLLCISERNVLKTRSFRRDLGGGKRYTPLIGWMRCVVLGGLFSGPVEGIWYPPLTDFQWMSCEWMSHPKVRLCLHATIVVKYTLNRSD